MLLREPPPIVKPQRPTFTAIVEYTMHAMIREAFLAATRNLVPAAPVDVLRFLRVPAIVWTIRRQRHRLCRCRRLRRRR